MTSKNPILNMSSAQYLSLRYSSSERHCREGSWLEAIVSETRSRKKLAFASLTRNKADQGKNGTNKSVPFKIVRGDSFPQNVQY